MYFSSKLHCCRVCYSCVTMETANQPNSLDANSHEPSKLLSNGDVCRHLSISNPPGVRSTPGTRTRQLSIGWVPHTGHKSVAFAFTKCHDPKSVASKTVPDEPCSQVGHGDISKTSMSAFRKRLGSIHRRRNTVDEIQFDRFTKIDENEASQEDLVCFVKYLYYIGYSFKLLM